MNRSTFVLTLAVFAMLLSGCAHSGSRSVAPSTLAPAQIAAPAKSDVDIGRQIQADPVAYLRQVLARAEALEHYRLTFYRQERLGRRLGDMEHINALFRKDPFSVKFTWDDPGADYFESVYVAGQNDGKLVVRERKGALPLLPPTVRKVDPDTAVKLGRARNPVTDFGVANVTRRSLAPFDDPELRRHLTVHYQGVVQLDPQNRPAHHLRMDRPALPGYQYTRQDFYIDTQTGLPAGTDLYVPSGELDARYRYADIDSNVNLTDIDFRLGKDHPD